MTKLLLQISHGFIVRNFINTGLAKALAEHFDIVLATWPEDVPFLADYVGPLAQVVAFPLAKRRFEGQLSSVRRYAMATPERSKTINVFSLALKHEKPVSYHLYRFLNLVLGRWRPVRRAWMALERRTIPTVAMRAFLSDLAPAAVISANYGTEPETIQIFEAARQLQIPSISIVPSWDNLSSKGVIGAKPDKLIVWNQIMKKEAETLHDLPAESVDIAGPLQFNVYHGGRSESERAEVCAELGISSAMPYIVYGTITPKFFPHNLEIVRHLAEEAEAGSLQGPVSIIVRVHPQVVDDPHFGENIALYEQLAKRHPSVRINVPNVLRWGRLRPAPEDDQLLLARMLRNAAVCIVPGSTLSLDAMAAGTPAIGLAYDGDAIEPYEKSIRRWYDYDYFKPIIEADALPLARSRQELVDQVNDFLRHPERNLRARTEVMDLIAGSSGNPVDQCVASILLASRKSTTASAGG